jgi:ATP synthase protein I
MPASYARTLRAAVLLTAPIALIMVAISAGVGGMKGFIGGLLAIALVIVFFGLSILIVGYAARISPQAMMIAALGTFLVKILALAVVVANFDNTTAFNTKLFGVTAIICIVTWSLSQAVAGAKQKMLYVEPVKSDGER